MWLYIRNNIMKAKNNNNLQPITLTELNNAVTKLQRRKASERVDITIVFTFKIIVFFQVGNIQKTCVIKRHLYFRSNSNIL